MIQISARIDARSAALRCWPLVLAVALVTRRLLKRVSRICRRPGRHRRGSAARSDVNPRDPATLRDGGNLRLALAAFPDNFNALHIDGNTADTGSMLKPTHAAGVHHRAGRDGHGQSPTTSPTSS